MIQKLVGKSTDCVFYSELAQSPDTVNKHTRCHTILPVPIECIVVQGMTRLWSLRLVVSHSAGDHLLCTIR